MLDNYKETQKIAYNILKNSLKQEKISHAYLIETMGNMEGFDFAISFAKALLCPKNKTNNLNCDECNICKLIDEKNFIELEIINTDNLWFKKENIDKLQKDFSFKPVIGKRKIYIINNAEKIKENLANKLLKFIEEPEEGIIAILITENHNRILNTIRSRCQLISLRNNQNENDKNLLNNYNEEIIRTSIEFIEYYEKNKLETIIYTNSLIHERLKERTNYNITFDIIIMYYNDILNYKLNSEIKNFDKYKKEILNLSNKLSLFNIIKKINILMDLKKMISNNINLNLLVDKLILSFEKVRDDE